MYLHAFRPDGRTLVVVPEGDKAAKSRADVYLRGSPLMAVHLCTPAQIDDAPGVFGTIRVFCADAQGSGMTLDMDLLLRCLAKMGPGGALLAWLGGVPEQEADELETTGLFAGATESVVMSREASSGGRCSLFFSCRKPSWGDSAAAMLPGAVSVDAEGPERINEDDLLGEVPAPVGQGKSDCSTKPRACMNCSCGRKDLEDKYGAEEAKTRLQQGKERSACGSCYLGDAFRCESCPYRGLPAFKAGNKVELGSGETEGTGQLDMRVAGDAAASGGGGGRVLVTA